ncbi:hypothetical protein HK099_004192 [Clydaea vesicula]|uniref:SUN domain-containing protein n=1 Tax=Clydaea vesicula TaxID=447962 RepID=A0AAD5Y1C7_9FUNG|nr:hypothetical protein HK099_004192 [Clydaea vesicula]
MEKKLVKNLTILIIYLIIATNASITDKCIEGKNSNKSPFYFSNYFFFNDICCSNDTKINNNTESKILIDNKSSSFNEPTSTISENESNSSDFTKSTVLSTNSETKQSKTMSSLPIETGVLAKKSERFNFANFDCGSLILAANREATGATQILVKSKDQYMLNVCSASKFVIVELCNEILVDTIQLANYEFFSSMFKEFNVYITSKYPPKNNVWVLIGHFKALNVRELQVQGMTMMEELHSHNEEVANSEKEVEVGVEIFPPQPVNKDQIPLTKFSDEEILNMPYNLLKSRIKSFYNKKLFDSVESSSSFLQEKTLKRFENLKEQFSGINNLEYLDSFFENEPSHHYNPSTGPSSTPENKEESGTQESIFKNILKRIKVLERNSTTCQNYIHIQHTVFLEVLTNFEKQLVLEMVKKIM